MTATANEGDVKRARRYLGELPVDAAARERALGFEASLACEFAALRAPLEARLAELTSERDELTALEKTWYEELHRLCAHWVGRIAESVDPLKHRVRELEARIAELEVTSKSAAAYGLPTTYRAAVEEVHEWREAAEEGAMTPSGLHKRLASDGRHHDEHHARQVELELRIAKLERELKSVQEYAAVAHQNGLDTYQAERTALLERIAELEAAAAISGQVIVAQADKIAQMKADFACIERLDAALAVEELASESDAARAMAVMRAAEPGFNAVFVGGPINPAHEAGEPAKGSRLWRCEEELAKAHETLARQDAECNRLVAAVREDTIAKAREALCKLAEGFFLSLFGAPK